MLTALLYGLVASSGFVVGVALGFFVDPPRRVLAVVVAFGAGTLVSALSFELMAEAFETGTAIWSLGGFMMGALIYILLDQTIDHFAAKSPRRTGHEPEAVKPGAETLPQTEHQAAVSGLALLAGTALDGIPENAAIGISLLAEDKAGLGLVLMFAVFLSNLPASVTSTVGMRAEGRSIGYILVAWGSVAVACVGSTILGYALLAGLPGHLIGAMLALAAGGIIAMLADTMMPEAFKNGGPWVALATAIGFACAFTLSHYTP